MRDGPLPLQLRRLHEGDEEAFFQGLAEWAGEDPSWYSFDYQPGMTFSTLLATLAFYEKGENLPGTKVPATMLYGFVDGCIVGRVSIRHVLNDNLLQKGGHIGWAVAPRFRRRGYAQMMIAQSLPLLKDLAIRRVLITCSADNIPSKRLIARLGAVLENRIALGQDLTERYWLDLP